MKKYTGYISDVKVKKGTVACTVEDQNHPDKKHHPCLLGRTSANTISLPPIDSKVLVEKINGDKIITQILSSPGSNGMEAQQSEQGAYEGSGSMSFVFSRGNNDPETITVQYNSDGYDITADVDGDITLNAGGNVLIEDGDTAKRVATVDHDHSTSDGATTTDTTENHN